MDVLSMGLLDELRTRSDIDCDSLDVAVANNLGPFMGSTSNQADAYLELLLPQRADLLQEALTLARQICREYIDVPFEELAFEIAMVKLSLSIAPHVKETIFIMSNPTLTSTRGITENAKRTAALISRISPDFVLSRLCIKVAATWEGLQACRQLKALNINTLATTVFTMEQAILAGECGCMYISPFVHELKAVFDDLYDDGGANLALCVDAQKYYKQYSYSTRVKAAALLSVTEAEQLAGVAAITIPPDLLRTLASTEATKEDVDHLSLFTKDDYLKQGGLERQTYMDDEVAYREAFAKAYNGKGLRITQEAIDVFRGYQIQAEQLMLEKEKKPHQDLAIGASEKETFNLAGSIGANSPLLQT